MSTIGSRIREKRMELGITVDELAFRLGKNRATVYRYESNDIENLPISVIGPLAEALHTSPAYLMGWTDSPNISLYAVKTQSSDDHRLELITSIWDSLDDSEKDTFAEHIKRGPTDVPSVVEKTAPTSEGGLSPLDAQIMDLLHQISDDHKEMLLAQLLTLVKRK